MLEEQFPILKVLAISLRECSLGTIWWIREEVWKSVLFPTYSSDREAHPGLCCRNNPIPPGDDEPIHCLHGTSKKVSSGQAFKVIGIARLNPSKATYFQWHLSGRIPFREFRTERCWPADKHILSPDEISALRRELQKRGLL